MGSATETVTPAAASALVFGQQPTNTLAGATISPAITVRVLDLYGNLESGDNSGSVSIALGANSGGGFLTGTTSAKIVSGVATFGNLSINNAGNGYTLTVSSGT